MKNKIRYLITVLIINFITIIDVNGNEPFNFDVTEIEIIDNGDTIKGSKGGTATTDNGLKIKADSFKYDKILNILNAFGNVEITDEINDYIILSEKITYIKDQEKIFTRGRTDAILESRYNFLSKNVLLLRNYMILSSNEKSSLKDKDIYLYKFDRFNYSFYDGILKAKNIEIISDYKKSKKKKNYY